jgi:fatty acid-binding protein DegV
MTSTCIITDSSAQFTQPGIPGKYCIKFLDHELYNIADNRTSLPKVTDFPKFTSNQFKPHIFPPTEESIFNLISTSLPLYDDIFIILLSKEISPIYQMVEKNSDNSTRPRKHSPDRLTKYFHWPRVACAICSIVDHKQSISRRD